MCLLDGLLPLQLASLLSRLRRHSVMRMAGDGDGVLLFAHVGHVSVDDFKMCDAWSAARVPSLID